jgi:hypothetical protein
MEQLFAWTQNQLRGGEAERIHAHLETGCTACQTQLEHLRQMLAATAGRHLLKIPDWLRQQGMNLFAWRQTQRREPRPERLPAFLLVDSFAEGPLMGFRSAGAMSRQMLYRAGPYNINLSMSCLEPSRAIDVMGQPMPLNASLEAVAGADVELLNAFGIAGATRSNEFGAFILGGVAEGIYDLRITLTDEELDIIGLNILLRPH